MIKKVVLISPPTQTNRNPEENLGLEYLAAESRISKHEVYLIDAWMENKSVNQIIKEVVVINPIVVGISPSMDSFSNTYEICDGLRKNGYSGKIVLGGIYASFESEHIVKKVLSIDGILCGEADISFQQFLKSLDISKIPGAVYLKNKKIIKNINSNRIDDLNTLPIPTRDTLPLVKLWKTPSHLMGSRGCYGNCSFCSVTCFQKFSSDKKWRGRSPESIVKELILLNKHGEKMIKFVDDNFFGYSNHKREKKIANLIIKSGIKIRFRLSMRVNDVDEEIISILKKAGLFAVSLGVESFVQRKLNYFEKGTTVEQNIRAIKILKKNGIFVQMGFIMFDPYTTMDEIKSELEALSKINWVVTKGILSKLFAADGTRITQKINEEIGFIGKEGANNLYEIKDTKARLFAKLLSYWTKKQDILYEMAIDPISSPKNISLTQMKKLHQCCRELKNLDIELAFLLHKKVVNNTIDEKDLFGFIDNYYHKYFEKIMKIKNRVEEIYSASKLKFVANCNIRI